MISTDNLLKIVIITTVGLLRITARDKGREPSSVTEQFLKPVTLEDIEEVFNKLSQDVNEAPQAAQTTQAAQAATQAATEATQATQAATEATQAATKATQAATEATQAPQTAQAEVPKGKQGFT